jgi:Asp-tRNA(Asn)/Glu-tRNA(Gln) amidotransferase A subunit family amidase
MSSESIAGRLDRAKRDIARYNPQFRAFSHLASHDEALVALLDREQTAGQLRSDIHGLSLSVKGSIPVADLPWTEGSAIFADRVAAKDATVVARARSAGAVVLGTTTLSELAMYGVDNPFEPMGLNPWNVRRTAGGSSTGAGVACTLGLADINIGTDSGGSIRNPACHCGVVGFMPRIGALSTEGTPGHSPSLSSIGLITHSVALLRRAFHVLSDDAGAATASRRLIVPLQLISEMSDERTRTLFDAAREGLLAAGFTLIERPIEGWLAAENAAGIISLYEGGQSLATMDLTSASQGIRDRAAQGQALTREDLEEAWRIARQFKTALHQALVETDADAVLTPTWPFAAPLIEASEVPVNGRMVPLNPHRNCFVRAANAIDACALTLPAGLYAEESVPFGIHLMALGGSELRLLAAAAAVEAALPPPPRLPLLDRKSVAAEPNSPDMNLAQPAMSNRSADQSERQ